jgi:hypothetical protein
VYAINLHDFRLRCLARDLPEAFGDRGGIVDDAVGHEPVLYVSSVAGFSSAQNRPALIEVGLLAVGAGPTLDFAGATAFPRRVRDRD